MRVLWVGLLSSVLFVPVPLPASAQAACKPAESSLLGSLQSLAPKAAQHYLSDPVLKRNWQLIVDCRHPSWPPQATELISTSTLPEEPIQAPGKLSPFPDSPAPVISPTVQAGSRVELWNEAPVHIRLSGTALQTALIDQTIRVRVGISGKQLEGIVRGPRSVQLVFDTSTRGKP